MIDIIDLAGDASARGRVFGSARREQVRACISDWLGSLRAAGIAEPKAYIAQLLRDTDFLPAIRKFAPDLLEEVQSIAAGSGESFELVLGSQLMDEEWAYRPTAVGRTVTIDKCSSVAIHARDGLTWIGQNMDLGGYTDGHQVAVRSAPHGAVPGALVFTIGAMIGLMGVNTRRVGVFVNAVPQLPVARKGVPVAFVTRKLLQASSLAQAVEWVQSIPHATGQHYLIADPSGIRSFEASAEGVFEYRSPDPSRVMHTNHPLAEEQGKPYPPSSQENSEARLRSLVNRLKSGQVDVETIKAALSSCDDPRHPVCRVPDPNGRASPLTGMIGFTTGSMVSTLEQRSQAVDSWISAGPPGPRGYSPVPLPLIA